MAEDTSTTSTGTADTASTDTTTTTTADTKPEDVAGLKSALEKERESRKAAEKDAKETKTLRAELEKIRGETQSESEKAIAAARKEAEDTVRGEMRRDRVLDKIETLAAKDFADPDDAKLRLAAQADDLLTSDGNPDADAIRTALAKLLDEKPHLKANAGTASLDLGNRGTSTKDGPGINDLLHAAVRGK